jgi:hypothetical protein
MLDVVECHTIWFNNCNFKKSYSRRESEMQTIIDRRIFALGTGVELSKLINRLEIFKSTTIDLNRDTSLLLR